MNAYAHTRTKGCWKQTWWIITRELWLKSILRCLWRYLKVDTLKQERQYGSKKERVWITWRRGQTIRMEWRASSFTSFSWRRRCEAAQSPCAWLPSLAAANRAADGGTVICSLSHTFSHPEKEITAARRKTEREREREGMKKFMLKSDSDLRAAAGLQPVSFIFKDIISGIKYLLL